MTRGQRRFGRRALMVGAGTLAAYEVLHLRETHQDGPPGAIEQPPSPPPPYQGSQQTVDLTVRWRHLERRVVTTDLLAAWQFDEGGGYVFDDVSGNGHPLFITGFDWNTTDSGLAGAIHRAGMRGKAVYLDGSRWLATALADGLAPDVGLTLSCWVRPDAMPVETVVLVGYGLAYTVTFDATGAITLTLTSESGASHVVRSSVASLAVGRWSQVTATATPSTGDLRLYVDGVLAASTSTSSFSMSTKGAHVVLGGRLVGALDEVTIHGGALNARQVQRLYVVGLPKVYTQTSESIDEGREVFSRFKGSEPVPHPLDAATVMTHRFANSTATEQGVSPLVAPAATAFVPGFFGGAWRATDNRLAYPSPLTGDAGTFEAWYQPIADPADPNRQRRKEIFTAVGRASALTLYTQNGRWCFDVRRPHGRTDTKAALPQPLESLMLEHVAVTWGRQPDGRHAIVLYVNGVAAANLATAVGDTTYPDWVGLGGTKAAPSFCRLVDVRICDIALSWGDICPRGQSSTAAAGLDLRDAFDRPPEAAPMLWRSASSGATWSHRRQMWEQPELVGDDPDSRRALFQGSLLGLHPTYHPDAFGHASSIEAGVAFPHAVDGWAGVFVQSTQPSGSFSGLTFMLNPKLGRLRLARYDGGRILSEKVLVHDFPISSLATYELTLTSSGDGIIRGFIDGTNVISLRTVAGWPTRGYAGMLTENTQAFFSNLHFCALTPATPASRTIRTRLIRYGAGAGVASLDLVPFRWHKRRGLLPWQYTYKNPEPAGNIAGAETDLPLRPIQPAAWRSEDSANSDLIVIDGQVLYFMRGNPRIGEKPSSARIGVLHRAVESFDGVHFTDPNALAGNVIGGNLLQSAGPLSADDSSGLLPLQLNAPSTAYVGDGKLLFFGRQSAFQEGGLVRYGEVVYSRYDVATSAWEHSQPQSVIWSQVGALSAQGQVVEKRQMHGSPEIVSLRSPDSDRYQAVIFQQTGGPGRAVMATALLDNVSSGEPSLAAGLPIHTSLSRSGGGSIYGFRVMFDNGIYYLHYNDGSQVPDWPDRFVLAATLDPYAGPWVANEESRLPGSTYFRRGSEFEPDNGAIWQGTMFKHRGRYYMYYENYHSLDDVQVQYEHYGNPQAGSRVGFATV